MKMLVEAFTKKLLKNHNIMSQSSFIKGRIEFMDMEDKLSVPKQVDPRTIEYVILDKVKYELK